MLNWFRSSGTEALRKDLGLLLLRLWFGLVLAFGHGWKKALSLGDFIRSVERHGFPFPELMAPFAMLSELAGGILLALGLFARPAAVFVMLTMFGAAFHVHAQDPFARKEFALAYAMAAAVVLLAGPGRFSLDARRGKRR